MEVPKRRRKPVNYTDSDTGSIVSSNIDKSFDSANSSFNLSYLSQETPTPKPSSRADAYIARITQSHNHGSVRSQLSQDPKSRYMSESRLEPPPTHASTHAEKPAKPHKSLPKEWTDSQDDHSTAVETPKPIKLQTHSSPQKRSSSHLKLSEREIIHKLKGKVESLSDKVKRLEHQLELLGVQPVTKGGSLNQEIRSSRPSKTEQKIAEIEAITLEIKKCLGLMPDPQSKTNTVTKTNSIAPAAEPSKAASEPTIQNPSSPNSPIKPKKASERLSGDKTPVNESPSVNHLKLSVNPGPPKVEEELSSDHLISIMNNFGF